VSVARAIKPPEGMRFSASPPELAYVLLGPPVPWQRARSGKGRYFTDPRMAVAQHSHRWMATVVLRCAMRAGLSWDDEDRAARYELHVVAHVPPSSRGDSDNYGKLVADALQKILYPNDRQLVRVIGERVVTREKPRTEVRIRRIEEAL
jgi:Holliday junction resolvase RusA-like endonuclease